MQTSGRMSGQPDGPLVTNTNASRTANESQRMSDGMDYPCVCGKRFSSQRGMKIHRTKMRCMSSSMNHEQRTASADKTSEDQGQVENHSAEDIQAYGTDEELVNLVDAKRQRIKFPPATEKHMWESLESRIIHKLDKLIGKSTLSHKLDTFGDIIYQTSLEMFGPKPEKTKEPPKKNRRQREMETLRKRKKNLKRQMKTATEEQKDGLKSIWRDLQARHTAAEQSLPGRNEALRRRNRNSSSKTHSVSPESCLSSQNQVPL